MAKEREIFFLSRKFAEFAFFALRFLGFKKALGAGGILLTGGGIVL